MRRRCMLASAAAVSAVSVSGCVTIGVGKEPVAQALLSLRDGAASPTPALDKALVPALLVQAQPANAFADTLSIAYSRREGEFSLYQLANWTERPVRQVPRLLQQRLQVRKVADAVGLLGDPMGADWLLSLGIDSLYHDMRSAPGQGRVALRAELFDRRSRRRVALAAFESAAPLARADSAAAAAALSVALAQAFDQLLPWLETQLAREVAAVR